MSVARSLSLYVAAGALGGLANSLLVWLVVDLGVASSVGVRMAPAFGAAWLYPRIVWGGIWGLLFALPFGGSWVRRGLLLSLAPSAVQLLVVFPGGGQGLFGLELGLLAPVFVLLFNAAWGLVAAWWIHATRA